MQPRRLSASKFSLSLQCVYPFHSELSWDYTSGYSAKLGKCFHRYAELLGVCDLERLMDEHQLTPALRRRMLAMTLHWKDWQKGKNLVQAQRELKMQIDPEFGDAAILSESGERNYSGAWPTAVTMTADVVNGNQVRDYKTGAFVEHPSTNPQMRLLSLAVSRVTGATEIESYIDRFGEDGYVTLEATHKKEHLDETMDQLHRVHLRIQNREEAQPSENSCRYCPVRTKCEFKYTTKGTTP